MMGAIPYIGAMVGCGAATPLSFFGEPASFGDGAPASDGVTGAGIAGAPYAATTVGVGAIAPASAGVAVADGRSMGAGFGAGVGVAHPVARTTSAVRARRPAIVGAPAPISFPQNGHAPARA